MCDSENGDLIDLSGDENNESNTRRLQEQSRTAVAKDANEQAETSVCWLPTDRRDSFDNNPFDRAQKLASQTEDPFESVAKEACLKALPKKNVKLGNLLSLSDECLLDDDRYKTSEGTTDGEVHSSKYSSPLQNSSTSASVCSTVYHSAFDTDLENESPPLTMSGRWTPESGGSSRESGEDSGNSAEGASGVCNRAKRSLEHRKRLLKLSLSNSAMISPVTQINPKQAISNRCLLSANYQTDHGDVMLDSESPLKLVDDEKEFEADLEMLKIPMLKKLRSPVIEKIPSSFETKETDVQKNESETLSKITNLVDLRAKLEEKPYETNNNHDISMMLNNLKSLICDSDVVDPLKKEQASSLLETISTALGTQTNIDSSSKIEDNSVKSFSAPQPIVRQGTFDIELQVKEEKENQTQYSTASTIAGEISHLTTSLHSTQSVQSVPSCDEIPDLMIKSSATYDGDADENKENLILPEVDPVSQPVAQQNDVSDIIEQLGKLLEQHQLTQNTPEGSVSINGSAALNPTFIVVMNSNQMPVQTNTQDTTLRRRSQSLSSHDKIKIVQLQPSTQMPIEEQTLPPLRNENPNDFKTPLRMTRRNSFSCAIRPMPSNPTSYDNITGRRMYGFSNMAKTPMPMRRSIATHHDDRQTPTAYNKPMPFATMNSFRPDIRKKLKSSESILKSAAPMKATIPVKKVAPMLKTSPPTPIRSNNSYLTGTLNRNLNSSLHMLTKAGRMSVTSTPMPVGRESGIVSGVSGSGYEMPSACSTPSVLSSPLRRGMTATNRPSSGLAAAASIRKRAELRNKSPIKPRPSTGGGASIFKRSTQRTPNKATIRGRESILTPNTRNSTSGAITLSKYKENRQP